MSSLVGLAWNAASAGLQNAYSASSQTALIVIPSTLFIGVAPLFCIVHHGATDIVRPGRLLWLKLAVTAAILFSDAVARISENQRRDIQAYKSSTTTPLSILATISLMVTINIEHRHCLQSSATVALLLIAAISCDFIRGYSLVGTSERINLLAILTTSVLKIALLLLNEVRKNSLIKDDYLRQNTKTLGGFITRSFSSGLFYIVSVGYSSVLGVARNTMKLDGQFVSKPLLQKFTDLWAHRNDQPHLPLLVACIHTFVWQFLLIAPAQLVFSLLSLSQPLLIRSIVLYVVETYPLDDTKSLAYTLITRTALTYLGIMMMKAILKHLRSRLATLIRSVFISAVYKKSLTLTPARAEEHAAVAIIKADVETAADGIPALHDTWANMLEFASCLYLLTTVWGSASFLALLPSMVSSAIGWLISKQMPNAQVAWNESMQARIAPTATMLANVKAIKMIGLDKVISKSLQEVHSNELQHFKAFKFWFVVTMASAQFLSMITSPLVLAGGLFWAARTEKLTPMDAFFTLVTINILLKPLWQTAYIWSTVKSTLACTRRIQEYLLLQEMHDQRGLDLVAIEEEVNAANPDAVPEDDNLFADYNDHHLAAHTPPLREGEVFHLHAASIGIHGLDRPILRDVTATFQRGEVAMILGPTGSGKSTLLQAFTGETEIKAGRRQQSLGSVAFCGQTVWLQSKSIRDNIIAQSRLSPSWYSDVLDACLLKPDLRGLPQSDATVIGTNGANLSGGQRCRIALARAVYSKASTLVLDDVFNSLDDNTTREICHRLIGPQGLLRRLGATTIIATNSSLCYDVADRKLLVTAQGRIIERQGGTDAYFQSQLNAVLVHPELSNQLSRDERAENDNPPDAQHDVYDNRAVGRHGRNEQRTGDRTLNLFYLRSFSQWLLAVYILSSILCSVTEMSPSAYLAMCLEKQSEDQRYFLGHIALSASASIFTYWTIWLLYIKLVPASSLNIHQQLLDTTLDATLWFVTSADGASLANLFNQDLSVVTATLPGHVLKVVYGFANVAVHFCILVSCSTYPYALLAMPILSMVLYLVQSYYLRTLRRIQHLELQSSDRLHTKFIETANGLEHIRAFGWKQYSLDGALRLLDTLQAPLHHRKSLKLWFTMFVDGISVAACTLLAASAVLNPQSMSGSSIGLALTTIISLKSEVTFLMEFWAELQTSIRSLSRIHDFIEQTPRESEQLASAKETPSLPVDWPQNGKVAFVDVTSAHGLLKDTRPVLKHVSTMLPAGRRIGIVGRTGSGKSSFLMSLLNFLDYTGRITIDGIDISTVPRSVLRTRITTVAQDTIEFNESIRFNLCPWTMSVSQTEGNVHDDSVIEMLKALQIWDLAVPQGGLEAKVSELGLSHGQKKLLCIARACLHKLNTRSRLVIMDESTSGLDGELEQLALQVMETAFWDCTVIEVAHRREALADADIILHMANGKIVREEHPKAGAPKPVPAPPPEPAGPVPMNDFFQDMLNKSLRAEKEVQAQLKAEAARQAAAKPK